MTLQSTSQRSAKRISPLWAAVLVAGAILYVLLQPLANSRLGWNLPSFGSLAGTATVLPDGSHSDSRAEPTTAVLPVPDEVTASDVSQSPRAITPANGGQASQTAPAREAPHTSQTELKFGLLKDLGGETYISPAGLRYTKGSEEGHRLKHLERHLSDIPDRPGKHGVFKGDMEQALRWMDEAFVRGKQGVKGVNKSVDGARSVYEVPFAKPIGYIGGRDGQRNNHPVAQHLRLVVEGNRFITGFPY